MTKEKMGKEDIVMVGIESLFSGEVATGYMSAHLVGKLNKAFQNERGSTDTIFTIVVKKSCQAERQKA
jgi:hypothetical protein